MEAAALPGIGHNKPPLKEVLADGYKNFATEIEAIAKRANGAPKTVKNETDLDAIGVIVKDARGMNKRCIAAHKEEKAPHLNAGREVDNFFKVFTDRLDRVVITLETRATQYQREKADAARRKAEEEAAKLREQEEAARRKAAEAEAAGKVAVAARAEARAETVAGRATEAERKAEASAADLAKTRGASGTVASAKTTQKVRIIDFAKLNLGPLAPYLDREAVQKAANAWLRVTKGKEMMPGLEVFDDVKATFR